MPTNDVTFAQSEMDMVWKQPYLTAGLNEKMLVLPRGVYRGFDVVPSGTAMAVTIVAALPKNDHLALVETQNNYSVTLRRAVGNFDVDLTPHASLTVVVALYVAYAIGTPTAAFLRVYNMAEYTALTAPEKAELTILATVIVPAAGVIPAANVTYELRTYPWANASPNAVPWYQLVRNGGFEVGNPNFPDNGLLSFWMQDPAPQVGTNAYFRKSNTNPAVGLACLEYFQDQAGAWSTDLTQILRVPVVPGQRLRLSALLKRLVVPASVIVAELRVNFADVTGALFSAAAIPLNLTGGVDAGYNPLLLDVVVPAGAATTFSVEVLIQTLNYGVAGTVMFRLDQISLLIQPVSQTQADQYGLVSLDEFVHAGQIVLAATPPGDFTDPEVIFQYQFGVGLPAEGAVIGKPTFVTTTPGLVRAPEFQWKGRMQLGELMLSTFARAQQPRLTMRRADFVSNVRTLILDLPPGLINGGFSCKVYRTWDQAFDERIEIVMNAIWNDGTNQWNKVIGGLSATRWFLNIAGMRSENVAAATAAWNDADWDPAPYQTVGQGGWSIFSRILASNNGSLQILNAQNAGVAPSNPVASAVTTPNTLYAKNIPKGFARIQTDGLGGTVTFAGASHNIGGITVFPGGSGFLRIILVQAMATASDYIVVPSVEGFFGNPVGRLEINYTNAAYFDVVAYSPTNVQVNPATVAFGFGYTLHGRQT